VITELLATQLIERQTITVNTGAFEVQISPWGASFPQLRQCRAAPLLGNYGYRYFQLRDTVIIRSLLIQVPAPISVSSQGIPLIIMWRDTAGTLFSMPELSDYSGAGGASIKRLAVPFENSECVIDTFVQFPTACNTKASIVAIIDRDGVGGIDHSDTRFGMVNVPAGWNGKTVPIVVYARMEHTLPMVTD
jgi:hypothetical protein